MPPFRLPLLLTFALLSACDALSRRNVDPAPSTLEDTPKPKPAPSASSIRPTSAAAGAANAAESATGPARADAHLVLDYPGPWFLVTARETGVYLDMKPDRQRKLAWARNGGRLAVLPEVVKNDACTRGWSQLTTGGYVCGNDGSLNPGDKKSRLTLKQPALDQVLPYKYARNSKHGTPLYRSIPSPEQMLEYEPYLAKKEPEKSAPLPTGQLDAGTPKPDAGAPDTATVPPSVNPPVAAPSLPPSDLDAGVAAAEELSPEQISALNDAGVPWWQQADASVQDVTLDQLEAEGDGILAKRMVAGFYVAVDSVFHWNRRTWYKTTKGLVAPADRFWVTAGPEFKGVELDGKDSHLPLAWVYGWRKQAPLYELDEAKDTLKAVGAAKVFEPLKLSGRTHSVRGKPFHELADGHWISDRSIRFTQPGPPPPGLQPTERWVDVNLSQQTLVVFDGARPVYATLISSGKSSRIKEKDHSSPLGEWRIREKHITTTMDGDGSAAGDLPYSIEDVPYAMYYDKSYALHGAFWHKNFGTQMSHGCINLSPLDAKWLFFYTDPPVPHGVHGVWAQASQPGSRVVVHE